MSYGSSGNFPNYGAAAGFSSSPSTMTSLYLYNQLCDTVSSNIFAVSNNATAIDRAFKQLGTPSDSNALRDRIQQTIHNTNVTVGSTSKCLKELAAIAKQGDRQQRLQLDRLRNEFQDVIQRYSNLQKQTVSKMRYTAVAPPQKSTRPFTSWNDDEEHEENEDEKLSLIESEKHMQKQKQLETELEIEQGLLEDRERRMLEIEADMIDVNQIMTELASMVHQQGETINTIEGNVESAALNTEAGKDQLAKARDYQQKYRKKLCCLVVILLIVATAIGLIVYLSLPKK